MAGYGNPQYDYDYGPNGPLAALQERNAYPDWPVQISPPVGWVDLVLALNDELASILPDYTIAQVKEKFGGLRYYIDSYGVAPDDPRIAMARAMIDDAESQSFSVCQICGGAGTLHQRTAAGNMGTLCDDHNTLEELRLTET